MENYITAVIGTKLSEAQQAALDPGSIGATQALPPKSAVEAQESQMLILCPYCGCMNYVEAKGFDYRYFHCRCCGCTCRA
jgi:hypothetical protein